MNITVPSVDPSKISNYTPLGHKLRIFTLRKAQFVTGGIIITGSLEKGCRLYKDLIDCHGEVSFPPITWVSYWISLLRGDLGRPEAWLRLFPGIGVLPVDLP